MFGNLPSMTFGGDACAEAAAEKDEGIFKKLQEGVFKESPKAGATEVASAVYNMMRGTSKHTRTHKLSLFVSHAHTHTRA